MSFRIIESPFVPDDKLYLVNPEALAPLTVEGSLTVEDRGLYDSIVRHEIRASFEWGAPIYESDPFEETIYLHSWADLGRLVRQIVAGVGYEFRKASGRPRIVGRMNVRAHGVLTNIVS